MAEIEHFCDPEDKSHPKFESVADQEMILYSACNQMDGKAAEKTTIGKAVQEVSQVLQWDGNSSSYYLLKLSVGKSSQPNIGIFYGENPQIFNSYRYRSS